MSLFEWVAFFSILFAGAIGGFFPFLKRDQAKSSEGFPGGQAFSAGVFLALAFTIMLPAGIHLFDKAFPGGTYPVSAILAVMSFFSLLGLEHLSHHLESAQDSQNGKSSGVVLPIIMIVMIAIPSFFLGTALGLSESTSAIFIFIAIMVHKSSAGFGLALNLARSRLSKGLSIIIYCFFLFATPVGILVGSDVHEFLGSGDMLKVKALILSLAAGVFLYMGSLHGLRHTPLVEHCNCRRGFFLMLTGFIITALVRLVLGLAHGG